MSTILLRRILTTNIHSRSYPTYKFTGRLRLSTGTTTTPPPKNTPRVRTLTTTVSLATFLSLTTYTLGVIFPPPTLSILFPRPAPAPPLDPKSPESVAYTESLESTLQSLPLIKFLRAQVDANEWYEARPYLNFPEERRVNNFTAGALRGPGKLALHPLVRSRKDESESLVFVHFGRGLCGHDGIVHGGVLATVLDETLARTVSCLYGILFVLAEMAIKAFNNLPDKLAVTANLSLNYRAPTRADQVLIIESLQVIATSDTNDPVCCHKDGPRRN